MALQNAKSPVPPSSVVASRSIPSQRFRGSAWYRTQSAAHAKTYPGNRKS